MQILLLKRCKAAAGHFTGELLRMKQQELQNRSSLCPCFTFNLWFLLIKASWIVSVISRGTALRKASVLRAYSLCTLACILYWRPLEGVDAPAYLLTWVHAICSHLYSLVLIHKYFLKGVTCNPSTHARVYEWNCREGRASGCKTISHAQERSFTGSGFPQNTGGTGRVHAGQTHANPRRHQPMATVKQQHAPHCWNVRLGLWLSPSVLEQVALEE